jgi:hypothetical protein
MKPPREKEKEKKTGIRENRPRVCSCVVLCTPLPFVAYARGRFFIVLISTSTHASVQLALEPLLQRASRALRTKA